MPAALRTIVQSITDQLEPQGIKSVLGPEGLQANDKPPRVVWVPARERLGPPGNAGGSPRQILTRQASVEVHLWAADYDAVEVLLDQVVTAIEKAAPGVFNAEMGEAGWLDRQGALQNLGRAYLLTITFEIPVVAAPYITGRVTSIPQTATLVVGSPPHDSEG